MGVRIFTMRKVCPACRCVFTISSAASVYCQHRDCKRKRRRDDYAAAKAAKKPALPVGSDGHLARALESGE
jgi:hypothetical protein